MVANKMDQAECYGCGEKHPSYYPNFPKDTPYISMYVGQQKGVWRAIVFCSSCMRRGAFAMWTDESEWDSKNPLVPYRMLPPYDHDDPECDDVSKYPSPQDLLKSRDK